MIPLAYYTGLSQCDLHALERRQIDDDGVVRTKRQKTGKPALVEIPLELLREIDELRPHRGPMFPLLVSSEAFRRQFQRVVREAGLSGPFKKLRKSSGTQVELLYPGCGHRHLANSRDVFERHYWCKKEATPLKPKPLSGDAAAD